MLRREYYLEEGFINVLIHCPEDDLCQIIEDYCSEEDESRREPRLPQFNYLHRKPWFTWKDREVELFKKSKSE